MTDTIIATLDGALHRADEPLLRPDDLGVLRGDGVFETTLAVDGVPRDLSDHLQRLEISAKLLDFSVPAEPEWHVAVDAVLRAWSDADGATEMTLRLMATRGPEAGGAPTCLVIGSDVAAATLEQRSGVRIRLLERGFSGVDVAAMPWLLPGAKTLSYAVNMAAVRHAKAMGDDDVMFVGTDGLLLEGPTSTLVLDEGGALVTPPREGILDGITVRRLFAAAGAAGWRTGAEPITPERLRAADGIYVASSVRMLSPVVAVDGVPREIGPRTAELQRLLRG